MFTGLRGCRAEISATRLASEYSYGDFRGDPGRLLEEYFDAYLYAANWGTRELAFRLPRALLDSQTARRYCDEEHRAWVTETAEHVTVRFRWDDDWSSWPGAKTRHGRKWRN